MTVLATPAQPRMCKACGVERARRGKVYCATCGPRMALAAKRRIYERIKAARVPLGAPKRCDFCNKPGHTIKTCDEKPGTERRQCLRCRDWAQLGKLYCLPHETTLADNEREGWFQES